MTSTNKEHDEGYEIDLVQIFRALLRNWWILVLAAVICAGIGYTGTKLLVTPKYSSYFTAYINNYNRTELLTSVSNGDTYARTTLARTTEDIAKSASVRRETAEQMGISPGEIQMSTSVDSNSGILTVRVIMADKSKVRECAQILSNVLTEATGRIIEGSSLQVIDSPQEPGSRYSPSYTRNTLIAALIGVLIVAVIIIILELKDDTLKEASELEDRFGVPVIGAIPDMASSKKGGYGKYGYGYSYGYGYGYSRSRNN